MVRLFWIVPKTFTTVLLGSDLSFGSLLTSDIISFDFFDFFELFLFRSSLLGRKNNKMDPKSICYLFRCFFFFLFLCFSSLSFNSFIFSFNVSFSDPLFPSSPDMITKQFSIGIYLNWIDSFIRYKSEVDGQGRCVRGSHVHGSLVVIHERRE